MQVRLADVALTHPGGQRAIDRLSLEVPSGERVAIIGPSGAGKTSILRVVGTAMRPTPGSLVLDSLVLDSVDPWALPRAALRRLRSRIGTIHQAPPLPLPFRAKFGTLHQDNSVTYDKKCRTRVTRFHGVFAPNSNHRGRVTPNGTVLVAVDLTVVPGRKSALGSERSPGSGGGDSGPPPRRLPNRQLTASWRP